MVGKKQEAYATVGGGVSELIADPFAFMHDRFTRYVEDRRREPRDDVLTALATATFPDGTLPEVHEVVVIAANLFGAGQETTVHLLSASLRWIAEHPEIQQALRDDHSLIPNFIEEVLRYDSPLKGPFRLSRTPTTVGGVDLPAGTTAMVLIGAANRDPRQFDCPQRVPARPAERATTRRVRPRHPQLRRCPARPSGSPHRPRTTARPHHRHPHLGHASRTARCPAFRVSADVHDPRDETSPRRVHHHFVTRGRERTMDTANQSRLDGKVAIVTGGAGGIGSAYSRTLAGAGASVVIADLDEEGAREVAGAIAADGLAASAARVDITDVDSVAAMVELAQATYGGVDILVNNAALMDMYTAPLASYPLELWDRGFRVNVTGALICTQAVVPIMRERGGGKIINQSSSGAFTAAGAYGIDKLALVGLTVALARELGPDRIHVNAIAPGMVETETAFRILPRESPLREGIKKSAAMRAFGQPDDLCGALLFLASSASDWMTGQTLNVDGGANLRI